MSKIEAMSDEKQSPSLRRVAPKASLKIGKSDRTRAAILNAALDFLWSRPFREMTVKSLMTSIGLSRSAFYHHFEDPHDLMETLLHAMEKDVFDATAPWFHLAAVK